MFSQKSTEFFFKLISYCFVHSLHVVPPLHPTRGCRLKNPDFESGTNATRERSVAVERTAAAADTSDEPEGSGGDDDGSTSEGTAADDAVVAEAADAATDEEQDDASATDAAVDREEGEK